MFSMKKVYCILFAILSIVGKIYANDLEMLVDVKQAFDILKNDTITMSYRPSENSFKFVTPDTIWIKKVKRPKEDKHYKLQWFYNPTIDSKYDDYRDVIYKDYQYTNDTLCFLLHDIELNRDIVYIPRPYECIKCYQMETRVMSYFKDSIIFYRQKYGSEDELYESTTVESCKYLLKLRPTQNILTSSIECSLRFQNGMTGRITKEGIKLNNEVLELITKEEFLTHNYEIAELYKKDSVLRLAKIYDHLAIHNNDKYGFEGDTMAIIKYNREPKYNYSWNTDSIDFFVAYAYGKEYTIKINSYEQIEDKVVFLDTADLAYLKIRGEKGYNRRIEAAKIWDKQNESVLLLDCVKDTSDIIWATLNYDTDFIQYIDLYGNRKYDNVSKPSKGTRIPIYFYGDGGDMNVAFWTSYEANQFAIGTGHNELTFENDSDRLYLMRSGRRNFEERVKHAVAADIAARMIEILEQEAKKEEKIKSLSKKKIFLLSMDKAYGDYDWCGIKPRFLNCYSKTIKYIDCMVVPYNQFGDQQSDDYGRESKEIRCVGPFEPGEIASWRFEDMFKNESGIIRSFKITNIKITFLDNSTIIYKGWENVKKHYEYVDF